MSRDMRFPTMWYVQPERLNPASAYALVFEYSMTVKLLTEYHLEVLG